MSATSLRLSDAKTLLLELLAVIPNVRNPAGLEAAFATMVRSRAGALIIVQGPMFFSHRKRLAELAVKHRLPTVMGSREYVEAGGLAGYGPDELDLFRCAATFVDKILKGAKPADLPVEQPPAPAASTEDAR